jgi:hypothetical protein
MRAVAGSGTPNRRNRSMPRPPLFGTTADARWPNTTPLDAGRPPALCSSLCCDVVDECVFAASPVWPAPGVTANRFSTVP